jgi:hypothetical protein
MLLLLLLLEERALPLTWGDAEEEGFRTAAVTTVERSETRRVCW